MNATFWYKKLLLSVIFSSSVVLTAGIYKSSYMSDDSFMQDDEIQFAKRQDETRYVASAERELPSVQYFPKNATNEKLIGGQWIITRIEDEKGNEIHNAKEVGEILVDFELKATSQVRIDGNNDYLFDISLLDLVAGRIALFRGYGTGYELVEARRLSRNERANIDKVKLASAKITDTTIEKTELKLDVEGDDKLLEVDLSLERVSAPRLSKTILINNPDKVSETETISGTLNVSEGTVNQLQASVVTKKGEININLDMIELKDGGVFEHEQDGVAHTGILTNNGQGSIKVRFSKGPYKGMLLSFVTDTEMERIGLEREEIAQAAQDEGIDALDGNNATDLNLSQEDAADARREESQEDEYYSEDINGLDMSYRGENVDDEDFEEDGSFEDYQDGLIDNGAIEDREEMNTITEESGYSF